MRFGEIEMSICSFMWRFKTNQHLIQLHDIWALLFDIAHSERNPLIRIILAKRFWVILAFVIWMKKTNTYIMRFYNLLNSFLPIFSSHQKFRTNFFRLHQSTLLLKSHSSSWPCTLCPNGPSNVYATSYWHAKDSLPCAVLELD